MKMKRHRNEEQRLLLDDICDSKDPAVRDFMTRTLIEEMDKAQKRALIRTAYKFKHMLSPQMQQRLVAQYPAQAIAASA